MQDKEMIPGRRVGRRTFFKATGALGAAAAGACILPGLLNVRAMDTEAAGGEEIRRSIKRGKKVMVYFANLPTPKRNKARNEFERIEKFKGKLGKNAIYHTYTDMPAFEAAFRQHLAGVINELLAIQKTKVK